MPKFIFVLIFAFLVFAPDSRAQMQMAANDDLLSVEDFYPPGHVNYSNQKKYSSSSLTEKTITPPASMNKNIKKQVAKKPVSQKTIVKNKLPLKKVFFGSFKGPYGNIIKPKPAYVAPKYFASTAPEHKKPVIVIDPGHGGKDRGTIGKLGTKEKDITLRYGLALKKALEGSGKYKVVMTRYDDRFIELKQRVNIARRAGGDVMISIHADSNPNRTTRGFSVYTLSNSRAKNEARKLLARSDKEEVVRGASLRGESKDVREAIIDFAQGSSKDVSDDFAKTIAKNLGRRIQALKRHNREGSLAVLTGADIPSVLIELGYLSNDYEERLLRTETQKQKITTSIKSAIDEYFSRFNLVF